MPMLLRETKDFLPSGDGRHPNWNDISKQLLTKVEGASPCQTWIKAAYSETGIYFCFFCEAEQVNCSGLNDGEDLYTEDVVELFLQPVRSSSVYLEYELSPLNHELVLMVCNSGTGFYGWLPFHYRDERRVLHKTVIKGGGDQPGSPAVCWTAEFYIPYALLEGIIKQRPQKDDVWYGNAFRIDYQNGWASRWAYAPECGVEFHDIKEFAMMIFE